MSPFRTGPGTVQEHWEGSWISSKYHFVIFLTILSPQAVSGNDTHLVGVSWQPSSQKPAQMSGCSNLHFKIRMLRDMAKHHTQGYMASEWQRPSKSRFPWNQKEHPSAEVQRKSMIGSGLLSMLKIASSLQPLDQLSTLSTFLRQLQPLVFLLSVWKGATW